MTDPLQGFRGRAEDRRTAGGSDPAPLNYTDHPAYARLPQVLKHRYTPKEYAWLGDIERNRIVERECYPDIEGDD